MEATIPPALSPAEFRPLVVSEIEKLSHDTSLFRFRLEEGQTTGQQTASCLLTMIPAKGPEGKPVVRPYTPTTPDETTGFMDLVVKKYETGVMSSFIHDLKVGDSLLIKGPIQKYAYFPNTKKELGLIAGGSGLTPVLQIMHKVLNDPKDLTKMTLLFANKTEQDIIMRKEIEAMEREHPDRLKIIHILSQAGDSWTGERGRVNKESIIKYMPKPELADSTVLFVCGPPGMMESLSGPKKSPMDQGPLQGILKELGYTETNVFKF